MDYQYYHWHKYSIRIYNDTIRVICWECHEMPNMVIMSVKNDATYQYYFRVLRRDADNTLHDITGKLAHMYTAKYEAWHYYMTDGISII